VKGTVLLVEDEYDTREMLARALARDDYQCLTAADAHEALRLATSADSIDVVVADVVLGADDRAGLSLLTDLRARGVRAPIVIITAYADVDKVKFALNEGAAHLLEKPFSANELILAIERVRQGAGGAPRFDEALARASLTEKERIVARHLLDGLSSSEIADIERNSPKTIRQHVSQIYAKCGVSSRSEFFRLMYSR
jgi:DNA-binding NarL/FixJ family response regulator